jgi:hypothetical protein
VSLTTSYGDEQLARLRWELLFLPLGDESFPLLRYVDPWGKTLFNRTQIEAVIFEFRRLIDRLHGELPSEVAEFEVATINGILELAEVVRTVPHHLLTLVGQ